MWSPFSEKDNYETNRSEEGWKHQFIEEWQFDGNIDVWIDGTQFNNSARTVLHGSNSESKLCYFLQINLNTVYLLEFFYHLAVVAYLKQTISIS